MRRHETYLFEGPYRVSTWTPRRRAAIFVVCGPPDLSNRYPILCVGESENLAERGFPWLHEKSSSWINHAGGKERVYIAFMRTDGTPDFQRRQWERVFVKTLNPPG